MKSNINLLDCTLRDGGYYNNWDFSNKLVKKYLNAISKAGVDVVEIGFRTVQDQNNYGAFAYSKDGFIETLKIPKSLKIAVMINAADFINKEIKLKNIFREKNKSKVQIIRIASHFKELNKIKKIISILKKKKYKIFLNLMQISERSDAEIEYIGEFSKKNKIDVLYFADSMGSIESSEIKKIIEKLRINWKGQIGIHTHDNLSRASQNAKIAFENGVQWIDSTVDGMGRGPGNLKTEFVIFEYQKYLKKKVNPLPLLELLSLEFKELKEKYKWGTNPFYYLSGLKKIHPSFVQTMLSDKRFTNYDILSTINYISSIDATKFNKKLIYNNHKYQTVKIGNWSPSSLIKNKKVLILGNGPSINENKKILENLIKQENLFVISLNTQKNINDDLIKLRAVSNEIRFLTDRTKLNNLKQKIVMPYDILSEKIKRNINKKKIYNFGLQIRENVFRFYEKYAVCPNSLAISYAISIANSGKAKNIYLAGIDGYETNDIRHIDLQKTFENLNENKKSIKIKTLTRTKLNIPLISVHKLVH